MNLKDAGIYDIINIFTGMSTDRHRASLGGIINDSQRIINIPAYQRPYRWKEENINQLFLDYDENDDEYFIGSAVAVENRLVDGSLKFDLVDGQQRITTLYLLSYIRYLLKKEYVFFKLTRGPQLMFSELCNDLKKSYVNLIGKNSKPFDNISQKINELNKIDNIKAEELSEELLNCYIKELCIPERRGTVEETLTKIKEANYKFFNDEILCLKYSRKRYDAILKDAICSVYLKVITNTNNYELDAITDNPEDVFSNKYIAAMKTIFNNIWLRAIKKCSNASIPSIMDICKSAIDIADDIIKNMSICIVLTENENDAYKLFEVLNDRSLEVMDLELIKNHFYKEYCTKSGDNEERQDKNITFLDEIWTDKIFSNLTLAKTNLISYLSAVYLTNDKELTDKNDAKYKNIIASKYSAKYDNYYYCDILGAFNVYFATRIILDKFDLKAQRLYAVSLEKEQENKSITYKTMHLLNALKYTAVMPALTNVIISTYIKQTSHTALYSDDFEKEFGHFIDGLIEDRNNDNIKYLRIHKCAYMLRISAIKGRDYRLARDIAKRIIETNGHNASSINAMELMGSEINELNIELDSWLNAWTYYGDDRKKFIIKVLLLNLLSYEKEVSGDTIRLKPAVLSYNLAADKLQLDHLEARQYDKNNAALYYSTDDIEKREKDVNGYLGNFMILDADENNTKNNVPLCKAIAYYPSKEKSWLIADIVALLSNEKYVDQNTKVPKEEFFKKRTKQLKKYFKAYLNKDLEQNLIEFEA